jgi:diamine N-acetyltransferase
MGVSLREATMEDFLTCLELRVAEDRRGFVAANVDSLAEAKADGVSHPLMIYDDEPVGFIMIDVDRQMKRGYVTHLVIDGRFQRRGYGRAAMIRVVERMKREPGLREILPSFHPDNRVAEALYASLGFRRTGEVDDGEIVVRLAVADERRPPDSIS